jgi:ligand-binding sensor domain-containing protein
MTVSRLINLLVVLLPFHGMSTLTFGNSPSQEYSIETFSVGEGLSQSTVFSLFQDSEGFIWLGTRGGGLNRFDGYNFDVFMHNSTDQTSLSNNEVISIYEDSGKSLWIGTRYGGLNRFDRNRRSFIRYQLDSLLAVAVNCIFEDEDKTLFLGTDKGLYQKEKDKAGFQLLNTLLTDVVDVTSIVSIDNNTLLLGAQGGIYKLTKSTRELEKLFEIPTSERSGYYDVPVMIDSKGNIWFGTPSGLYVFADSEMKKADKNPFGIDELDRLQSIC